MLTIDVAQYCCFLRNNQRVWRLSLSLSVTTRFTSTKSPWPRLTWWRQMELSTPSTASSDLCVSTMFTTSNVERSKRFSNVDLSFKADLAFLCLQLQRWTESRATDLQLLSEPLPLPGWERPFFMPKNLFTNNLNITFAPQNVQNPEIRKIDVIPVLWLLNHMFGLQCPPLCLAGRLQGLQERWVFVMSSWCV